MRFHMGVGVRSNSWTKDKKNVADGQNEIWPW